MAATASSLLTLNGDFWGAVAALAAVATLIILVFDGSRKRAKEAIKEATAIRTELDNKMSYDDHNKICEERDGRIETKIDELNQKIVDQNNVQRAVDSETKLHREKMYQDLGGLQMGMTAVTTRVDMLVNNSNFHGDVRQRLRRRKQSPRTKINGRKKMNTRR